MQIVNEGSTFYAAKVIGFRDKASNSIKSIDHILKYYSYYDDIEQLIRRSWNFQGQFFKSINLFVEAISALPETSERNNVLLLKPQGDAFSDVVDQYSKWVKDTKQLLTKQRKKELESMS